MKFEYGASIYSSTKATLNMTHEISHNSYKRIDNPVQYRQPDRIRSQERVVIEARGISDGKDNHLPSPFPPSVIASFKNQKKQKLSRRLPKVFNFVKGSRNISLSKQNT